MSSSSSSSDQKKQSGFERFLCVTYQDVFPRCLASNIKKASYIKKLKDNADTLKNELQKLIEQRDDVMWRVVLEEQQGKQRLSQVQGWLSRVKAKETEVGELIRDSPQEIGKLSLGGYWSKDFRSSYKFGKKVVKKLGELTVLKSEGDFKVVADEKVPTGAAVGEKPTNNEPTTVDPQPGK